MNDASDDFRIRIGRMRDIGGRRQGRSNVFVAEVLQAAFRAGGTGRGFGGGGASRRSRFGRGRGAALASALRSPSRRVVVQVRVVRHAGRHFRAAPLSVHLLYLKREGVDRDGGAGRLFDREGEADGASVVERWREDRHHFRILLAPEDAAQMADLRAATRELMAQAEKDLGTALEWVAVEHWNTAHPHVHLLLRGRADDGKDLVISRDYITRGLRARAEGLVSLELGPRTAREIAADLQRQTTANRLTGLDRVIAGLAVEGVVDLRPGGALVDKDLRPLLAARAGRLEGLGLATRESPGVWRLDAEAEARLRELAIEGDIVKTLHRAMGEGRALHEMSLYGEASSSPIVGRVAERGLFDEQSGSAYVVVEGLDGRAHHVRVSDLGAAGDTPVGGIVETRPGPGGVRVLNRSDLPIEDQILAEGATWLDRQLVASGRLDIEPHGFGAEVLAALRERAARLEAQGLASRRARTWTFPAGLLAELRRRELALAGAQLEKATGLVFTEEGATTEVRGRYRQRIDLASGRFAMVEDGMGFRLVPWASALDPHVGELVRGRRGPGGFEWELGRKRGLSR
jgi:type IV secretory pathway VirD2 relaxase